jgi:hypothetical protein
MTLALLIYSCADVSVLEYYEGNLALGIISYRQIFKSTSPDVQSAGSPDCAISLSLAEQYPHSDTDNLLFDDNDCFCCTAQAAINPIRFAITLVPLIGKVREPNFVNLHKDSEFHLLPFYRPPRFI